MKGSITRRCYCTDPDTGRDRGAGCPQWDVDPKHGVWEYRDRLPVSAKGEQRDPAPGAQRRPADTRSLRRSGFPTKKAAAKFRDDVYALLALAKGDAQALGRIGDLVFATTRRGGALPAVEDVRRRLGLRGQLDRSMTVGEWLAQWFAGKRALRESTARLYRGHLDHFLVPHLGAHPLDRLTSEHIGDLFTLIESWNAEIAAAKAEDRRPALAGDVRTRGGVVGVATQRRIFATLRTAMSAALKARRIDYNPCDGVEMPAEHRQPALVWSPDQVATFLDATAGDRLGLLFRVVLLRGLRRGEVVGLRWSDVDLDGGQLRVAAAILQLGGRIVHGRPKSRAGERWVSLDAETVRLLRAWRTVQKRERMQLGKAYIDSDLVFCWQDGAELAPDYVSRRFRELSAVAGLPRIKLHEGRHTAASLALEAGLPAKVVSEQLGHSTTAITENLYQHVRRAVHDRAAEAVVELLPKRPGRGERTGS